MSDGSSHARAEMEAGGWRIAGPRRERKLTRAEVAPHMYRLVWRKETDTRGTTWVAASVNCWGEDDRMEYKLRYEKRGKTSGWWECGDAELMLDDKSPRCWANLTAAKRDLQKDEKESVLSAADNGELTI